MVCRREKILAALLRGLSRAEDEGEGKERGEAARTGGAVAGCCAREGEVGRGVKLPLVVGVRIPTGLRSELPQALFNTKHPAPG